MRQLKNAQIHKFKKYLIEEEKSKATLEKYVRDIEAFHAWLGAKELDKSCVLSYKAYLCEKYATASVNSMLSSINSFFTYLEWYELRVKTIKVQKQIFASNEKELTKNEYERLLTAAKSKSNQRLYLLMQTICSTGIRVSEVRYITVEAVSRGIAEINCKGKRRQVFLPKQLCQILKQYIKEQKIKRILVSNRYLEECDETSCWTEKVIIEFENVTHLSNTFYYCRAKTIPHLDLTNMIGSTWNAFAYSSAESVTLHVSEKTSFYSSTFENMTELKNLIITGTIAQNGFDVHWSTMLSKDSIVSIINALSDTTTGLTITLYGHAVDRAFSTLGEEDVFNGTGSDEWLALVASKPNWNIALV